MEAVFASEIFDELGVVGSACAALIDGPGVGIRGDDLVTPASVGKVQIALAVEHATVTGALDGQQLRILSPQRRTAGPVGISLLRDEVRMSVRDLVTMMLTISDNVATDELVALVGPAQINQLTAELGLASTRITGDLRTMLDAMAREAGFTDYPTLAAHDPAVRPRRGSRSGGGYTTAQPSTRPGAGRPPRRTPCGCCRRSGPTPPPPRRPAPPSATP
jgi:hypothetical protein